MGVVAVAALGVQLPIDDEWAPDTPGAGVAKECGATTSEPLPAGVEGLGDASTRRAATGPAAAGPPALPSAGVHRLLEVPDQVAVHTVAARHPTVGRERLGCREVAAAIGDRLFLAREVARA